MTQEQLGQRLGVLLGREWTRQAVSAAERGARAFTAAELVAIAFVLGTNVGRLLTPPVASGDFDLPGAAISPADMRGAAIEYSATESTVTEMGQTIARIVEQLSNILDATAATVPNAALLWDQLAALPVLEPVTPEQMAAWQAEAARRDEARGLATAPKQPIATAVVTSTSPLGVLIGRRNDGKPPWTFIAGEVEPGEEPEFAAERETKEETGLEVRAVRRLGERIHPKTGRDMIYIACAPTVGTDIFVGDPIELAEVKWASLAEADELLPGMFGPVHEYLSQELAEGD